MLTECGCNVMYCKCCNKGTMMWFGREYDLVDIGNNQLTLADHDIKQSTIHNMVHIEGFKRDLEWLGQTVETNEGHIFTSLPPHVSQQIDTLADNIIDLAGKGYKLVGLFDVTKHDTGLVFEFHDKKYRDTAPVYLQRIPGNRYILANYNSKIYKQHQLMQQLQA